MNIVLFVIVQVLILVLQVLGCIHAIYILLKWPVVVPVTYDCMNKADPDAENKWHYQYH